MENSEKTSCLIVPDRYRHIWSVLAFEDKAKLSLHLLRCIVDEADRTRDDSAAHRAGAREACAKLSDWAFGAMEGEGMDAYTAYENCHVTAENLKRQYAEPGEEKKG